MPVSPNTNPKNICYNIPAGSLFSRLKILYNNVPASVIQSA